METYVLTQERFELLCYLGASLKERKDSIEQEMKKMRSGAMVICNSLEDARRYHFLKAQSKEVEEEMRELAEELEAGGLPFQVWVRFKRYSDDGSFKLWRVQIRSASGSEKPYLGMERS